jgi:hypothetical protein
MIATRRFTILLDAQEAEALIELAKQELRPARDQARAILRDALRKQGLLADAQAEAPAPADVAEQGKGQ